MNVNNGVGWGVGRGVVYDVYRGFGNEEDRDVGDTVGERVEL